MRFVRPTFALVFAIAIALALALALPLSPAPLAAQAQGSAAAAQTVQKAPAAAWSEHDVFQYVWMEDSRAFLAKLGLVTNYHLRGYSVWVLGSEDPATWRALK